MIEDLLTPRPLPLATATSTTMATYIALLLAKAAKMHPRIMGQPTYNDIFAMTEVLFPILHNADYDTIVVSGCINHNLVGLIQLGAA